MIFVFNLDSTLGFMKALPFIANLSKKENKKINFIFKDISQLNDFKDLLLLQKFTEIVSDFSYNDVNLLDEDQVKNMVEKLSANQPDVLVYRHVDENSLKKLCETYELTADYDFTLNLDLQFSTKSVDITCSEELRPVFPYFNVVNNNDSLLIKLQNLAYSHERHLVMGILAIGLVMAKIPFYLYLLDNQNGLILANDFVDYSNIRNNLLVFDVRSLDSDNNLVSIYDKFYFKSL
jgi:hypothetical protein